MLFMYVFVMLSHLLFDALWSSEWKGLTYWLLFVVFIVICFFPFDILGQLWYLVVSIPDPCCLSYFITLNMLTAVFAYTLTCLDE